MKDEISLKNLKVIENKILKYGFQKDKDRFFYSEKIMSGEFLLEIQIEGEVINSSVTETSTGEKFALYDVENHQGAFVGEMRKAYDEIIEKIKENCTENNIFKNIQTKKILEYVKEKFDCVPEFLWKNFPDYAAVRNKQNEKWFGIIMVVPKIKIGIDEAGLVEILDLMLDELKIQNLVDNKNYFHGYHMNKKHWITIPLDERVNSNKIFEFLDESYQISISSKQIKKN